MAIRLITSQEIVSHTSMGANVDADKYMHFLDDVQVMVLENVLGTKLYNKIIEDFENTDLSGLYLQMFDSYIKPVLWHSVFAEYVKLGSVLIQNGGIYKHQPNNAEIAKVEDIIYVVKNAQSKADTYIDRLTRFLCDQESNIPEYTTNQDTDYDIDPKSNINTISGWYFGSNMSYDKDWRISNANGSDEDALLLE